MIPIYVLQTAQQFYDKVTSANESAQTAGLVARVALGPVAEIVVRHALQSVLLGTSHVEGTQGASSTE